MSLDAWVFLLGLIVSALLLFAMVFYIILFSDLECDYVNPIDLCTSLNKWIIPEYVLHAVVSLLTFVTGPWTLFIWNLPLVFYHCYKAYHQDIFLDATEIFRLLNRHKRDAFAKLGFYLVSFFFYLYALISTVVGHRQ